MPASDIYFGLSPLDVKKLAHQYAMTTETIIPDFWKENKCAGDDCFGSFLKRHPKLSIRKSEATSMAKATSFNKHNVGLHF